MKIFVLGRSGVGKTPFSKKISEATGWPIISASEWVKTIYGNTLKDRDEYTRAITEFSIRELHKNADRCINFIKSKYDLTKPCIIEGIRNPHDFVHLYNPAEDIVVFLDWTGNKLQETGFERSGLKVIQNYLNFLCDTGILEEDWVLNDFQETPFGAMRVYDYKFACFFDADLDKHPHANSLENIIRSFVAERLPKKKHPPSPKPSLIHVEIKPLEVKIRKEFIFDMDPQYIGHYENATLFAVSSYPDSVLTFKAMVGNGSVFSYLPTHAIVARDADISQATLGLDDLVYHNCRLPEICVSYFDFLAGSLWAYFKKRNLWLKGSYIFTVDWYTDNDLLHFIQLENGQYAFLPQHKIKFRGSDKLFPPYKKLRQEWRLEE